MQNKFFFFNLCVCDVRFLHKQHEVHCLLGCVLALYQDKTYEQMISAESSNAFSWTMKTTVSYFSLRLQSGM